MKFFHYSSFIHEKKPSSHFDMDQDNLGPHLVYFFFIIIYYSFLYESSKDTMVINSAFFISIVTCPAELTNLVM